MKPVILVVEDHQKILLNIKLMLEFNDYEPITASNGKKALEVLSKLEVPPDVIISDIMMPEMNGYDFFSEVSKNSEWYDIPFIFLTAKSDPDDVRLGKMLGVDDYITKPFEKEDLLASIAGKLAKKKKTENLSKKITQVLNSLEIHTVPSEDERDKIYLILVSWDEDEGPIVQDHYPDKNMIPFSIDNIGIQLFQTAVSLYGDTTFREAQGVLLNIANIERVGYLFFDATDDPKVRGGKKQFMLGLLAPKINYFNSLKIKEVFIEISLHTKENREWNIKKYWEKIADTLISPVI
ncbi:MAG: PleD family two-component system response regulator [Candidatus Hodarchaeota archaeon]